ncbi:hypothetical protein BOO89_01130 [Stutzerimonas stutzeri]|nr:hypothetical protein BOO89_01130 [Stutzerimonas stutzeri]
MQMQPEMLPGPLQMPPGTLPRQTQMQPEMHPGLLQMLPGTPQKLMRTRPERRPRPIRGQPERMWRMPRTLQTPRMLPMPQTRRMSTWLRHGTRPARYTTAGIPVENVQGI